MASTRKAAIVTGSATGVGAATALALAGRGHDVLINYSKSATEAEAAHEVGAPGPVGEGDAPGDVVIGIGADHGDAEAQAILVVQVLLDREGIVLVVGGDPAIDEGAV